MFYRFQYIYYYIPNINFHFFLFVVYFLSVFFIYILREALFIIILILLIYYAISSSFIFPSNACYQFFYSLLLPDVDSVFTYWNFRILFSSNFPSSSDLMRLSFSKLWKRELKKESDSYIFKFAYFHDFLSLGLNCLIVKYQ